MNISNSPDISLLQVQVTWDLSGTLPVIKLLNQSQGAHLNLIDWAFTAISPSGTFISQGNIDAPDISGDWTNYTDTDTWPKPFNQIEWSGLPYQFYVTIKDSIGNVYTSEPQETAICRPLGNTQKSTTPYGIASSTVRVDCQQARIFFQDTTAHNYKGLDGTPISSTLKVIYPIDPAGNIPDPFSIASYSTALVPISYSSANYQFLQNTVYEYDLGNNSLVRIRYQVLRTFPVWCNIDLMPLQCEISKLSEQIINGNCSDVAEAQNKLNAIIPKFMLVVMGTLQPLLGVNVPKLIEEIETIGGFNCNCCVVPTGIIPTTASIIGGYSFSVNKLGGDVNGNFATSGSNITLNIGDVSYVVRMGLQSPSSFSASAINYSSGISSDGFTKTFYLNIDGILFQRELLVNIGNDPTSLAYLNSLIDTTSGNWQLIVDGACIFTTSQVYDYVFTLHNIPANTTAALMVSIGVGATVRTLVFPFNLTFLPQLQTYLNGLGLGTFVVTNSGGGVVTITSTSNPNIFTNLTYKVTTTNYIADMSSTATGYVPLSANQVVQNIIYYLCDLDDTEVKTSQAYVVSYIDPTTGNVTEETVASGETLNDFIVTLLDRGVDTINYIISLSKLNCDNLKEQFPTSTDVMQANDIVFTTKNGACSGQNPVELATRQIQLGAFDTDYFNAFCNMVNNCRLGHPCTPFSTFTLSVVDHSPADNEQDIIVTFSNNDTNFVGVLMEVGLIQEQIHYQPVGSGVILPGASPYTIPDLDQGQYSVKLTPQFSDGRTCPPVFNETAPCTGIIAFSATFDGTDINVTYVATSPKVKINVTYPNGGSINQIYNNGASISITPPTGLYGNYSLTIQPVCNETTSFIGSPTSPVIIPIAQPTGNVSATMAGFTTGAYVTAINGLPLFNLTGNLTNNTTQNGIHTGITATPITFSVINPTASGSAANGVDIYKNASFVTRVEFNAGTGIYTTANLTIADTDTVLFDFNNDL